MAPLAVPCFQYMPISIDGANWATAVNDSVRRVETKLTVDQPGYHTLRIGVVDPGLVLEKLVLSAGALKPSYLGPPESFHGSLAR